MLPTGREVKETMVAEKLILLWSAVLTGFVVVGLLILSGCGASYETLPAPGDADSDSDVDADSDSDSDSDSGSESESSSADLCADSCGNGTCDCGEDSTECLLDCPVTWVGCAEPHGARTCDEYCDMRGLFCAELCASDLREDGPIYGMESCITPGGPPHRADGCGEPLAEGELINCCCGRSD